MQRIIFSNNGVLTDLSITLNDADEGTYVPGIVAAEDYLYVASPMPFNHKWFQLGTVVNAASSAIAVHLWHDNAWQAAADVMDYTSTSGATLAKSGVVQFRPEIESGGWTRQRLSSEVTGIEALEIYNMYWVRFSFSQNLTAGTVLKYVGQRFSKDTDLYAEYPDLNNTVLLSNWASGKTTWDDQHALAANRIIQKLISSNIIYDSNEILDWELFTEASVHKTAEIIYAGLGPSMLENRKIAIEKYDKAINMSYFNADKNGDAVLDDYEKRRTTAEMSR